MMAVAPPAPSAEPSAWATLVDDRVQDVSLTKLAADLRAANLREQNRGRDFVVRVTPLYAHPAPTEVPSEPVGWVEYDSLTNNIRWTPSGVVLPEGTPLYARPAPALPAALTSEPVAVVCEIFGSPGAALTNAGHGLPMGTRLYTHPAPTEPTAACVEAMRMALEFCEQVHGGVTDSADGTVEAITVWCPEVIDALRAQIEQIGGGR